MVDGVRVANSVVRDGSGQTKILVSGTYLTPQEAEQGVKEGWLQCTLLPNGRRFYRKAVTSDASISNEQRSEEAAGSRILAGLLGNPTLRDAVWNS